MSPARRDALAELVSIGVAAALLLGALVSTLATGGAPADAADGTGRITVRAVELVPGAADEHVRVRVTVVLSSGDDPLDVRPDRFGLEVPGRDVVTVLATDLAERPIPAHSDVSSALDFDVPAELTTVALTYEGFSVATVEIPPPPPPAPS